jgi:hypothetical protein
VQAVRQVVFTDVLIVGRLDVHCQSFAPIGLHKIDDASDWLLIKRVCIGIERLAGSSVTKLIGQQQLSRDFSIYRKKDVLSQLKIRSTSEKFKNQPRPLLRHRSVNFRQHFRNLSHKTVPLKMLKRFAYLHALNIRSNYQKEV